MQAIGELFEDLGEKAKEFSDSLDVYSKLILSRMESMRDE